MLTSFSSSGISFQRLFTSRLTALGSSFWSGPRAASRSPLTMGRAVCAYKKAAVKGFLGALGSFSFFSRLRLVPLPGLPASAAASVLSPAVIACAIPFAVEEAASMAALAVDVMLGGS